MKQWRAGDFSLVNMSVAKLLKACLQSSDRAIDVAKLVEPEESDSEGREVIALAAHQWHPSSHLNAELLELRAATDLRVVGVGHYDGWGREAVGGDGRKAVFAEHGSHSGPRSF